MTFATTSKPTENQIQQVWQLSNQSRGATYPKVVVPNNWADLMAGSLFYHHHCHCPLPLPLIVHVVIINWVIKCEYIEKWKYEKWFLPFKRNGQRLKDMIQFAGSMPGAPRIFGQNDGGRGVTGEESKWDVTLLNPDVHIPSRFSPVRPSRQVLLYSSVFDRQDK